MRIAIMGAGGIGAYVGARLAAAGEDVAYVARGAHLAAMRQSGLRIDSPHGDLHLPKVTATDDPSAIGPVDLVIFAVKLWDTDAAAAQLRPLIAPHTRVVTFQNGIDSVDLISRHVPAEQVVGGVIYIPAVIAEPGVIRNPGGAKRTVVGRDGGNRQIEAFLAASERALGVDVELTDAIGSAIWEKFVRFSAFSAATTLMRSSIGPILAEPEAKAFVGQLLDEGVAVAAATGNPVGDGFAEMTVGFYAGFPPEQRASMADDLARGKPLELRWASGRIHALGLEHGIPTPAHTAAYRALILHAG